MPQIYVPMTALPAPPGAHQSPGTGAFIARAAPTADPLAAVAARGCDRRNGFLAPEHL